VKNGKIQLNYNFGGGRAAQGQEAQNQATIQAVKNFMETIKDSTLESLTKFSTADLVVWTPGLGPAPLVGREAVYRALKESIERNEAVGFRSELLEVLFASGPYVITRRNDYRVLKDGSERSGGSNIMGLYVVDKDGKVIFWYNPGGAEAPPR
jgi:limonene-1,2-epoxide hydrolase